MTTKRIASRLAMIFGSLAILVNGCSSSSSGDDSSADQNPINDAGPTPDEQSANGDPACFDPASVLTFSVTPLAPVAYQAKCESDALISEYLSACVAAPDAGAESDAETSGACAAYLAAHAACALCLGDQSASDAGASVPWPALEPIDFSGDVLPAVAACVAAISSGTDACKVSYASSDLCVRSGCVACTSTDFPGCATAETNDATTTCATADPIDATCVAAIKAVATTDADSKCGASTTITTDTDFDAVFLKVGRTLCGTNSADF